jgi:hypothetical protein
VGAMRASHLAETTLNLAQVHNASSTAMSLTPAYTSVQIVELFTLQGATAWLGSIGATC